MEDKTVVYKENTLCVLENNSLTVLNGLGTRDGKSMMQSPVCYFKEEDIRPATREDFDTFKVQFYPPGYILTKKS